MAETIETPEDFTARYCTGWPECTCPMLRQDIKERDSAIAAAARREERARIVRRLRDEAEQYAEIDRARDWYNMAADLIESEAT